MTNITDPIFTDETKAREHLEALRWPDGPYCPHCGEAERCSRINGKSARPGLHYCLSCKKQFTVTVGTVFERSKIPLTKWLLGFALMTASKKGISAHQLHRTLGITYKSAWFMSHRIREAMRPGADFGPLGGEGVIVEADETWVGGKSKNRARRVRLPAKEAVVSLVERGGRVRSEHVGTTVNAKTLRPILVTQIDRKSHLMTDESKVYPKIGREFDRHSAVNHSANEYVRGDAHTNTVENYYSILKRGIIGTYHHVSPAHLKRYVGEFDYRYNEREALGVDDATRMAKSIQGIVGKRLTYRRTRQADHA